MKRFILSAFVFMLGCMVHGSVFAQTVSLGKPATLRAKTTNAQSYEWTFPNGIVINGEVVQFTFTEPGPQEVKLKVTDFEGNTNEITRTILVANDGRPTAIIELSVNGNRIVANPADVNLGDAIVLSSASFGVEKSADDFTNTWSVNGRVYPETDLANVFSRIGLYNVILSVSDPQMSNQKDETSFQIRVVNQAPVVSGLEITPLTTGNEQFRVRALAQDADGSVESYKFEALDAGKPLITQVVSADNTVFDLSRFPGRRSYNFRVTVTDDLFATGTYTDTQVYEVDPIANNTPPTVSLKVVPGNQAYVGDPFNFQAEATDADGDALRYEWMSSDGIRYTTRTFQKVYLEPGRYNMELTVSDGLESTKESVDITILSREVTAETNAAPEIEITGVLPGQTGSLNDLFQFYLKAQDADGDRLTYNWDFGNGAIALTQNAAMVYQLPGTYTVEVTVSDGIETATAQTTITVEPSSGGTSGGSVEKRLESLQAQRAALEAAIAANGGEITPEQEALLNSLNNDVEALIREASGSGDTETLNQLNEINEALESIIADIPLGNIPGLTPEDFVVEMTAEQQARLEALQAAQELAAQMQAERVQTLETNISNVKAAEVVAFEEAADQLRLELESLSAERAQLEQDLATAQQNSDTQAQAQIAALITQIDTAIADSESELAEDAARQQVARDDLRDERDDLLRRMESAEAANDQAAQERLQGLIDDNEAATAILDSKLEEDAARLADTLSVLESDRERLVNELEDARERSDNKAVARLEALITFRDDAIAESERQLAEQNTQLNDRRTEIENERQALLDDLRDAEADSDEAAAARIQELIDNRTAAINRITEELARQDVEIERRRTDIEAERNQLLQDLAAAEAASDQAAQVRLQALIDNRNAEAAESEALLEAEATRQAELRAAIGAERDRLMGELQAAQAASDVRAEERINALIQSREDAIAKLDAAQATQNETLAQEIENLENERALLTEALEAAEAAQDTRAQAEIQTQIDRRDAALAQSQQMLLDQQTQLANQVAAQLEDWEALRSAEAAAREENNQIQANNIQRLIDQREAAMASNTVKLVEYQAVLAGQQTALSEQRAALKADLEAAEAASDARAVARLEAQIEARDAAYLANAEALLAQQDVLEAQQTALDTRRTELLAELETATATRDSNQEARIQEQIQMIDAALDASTIEQLNQQSVLAEQNVALKAKRDELNDELQTARDSADAARVQAISAQMAEQERIVALSNQAMIDYQTSLSEKQERLSAERARLKAEADAARAQADTIAASELENQQLNLTQIISEYNAAANAHRQSLEQQKADLEAQRDQLAAAAREAMQNADMAQAQRLNVQLQQIEASLAQSNQAIAENRSQAQASQAALDLERQSLLDDLKVAEAAADATAQAHLKKQLAQIELIQASFDRLPNDDFVAQQRARYEAQKIANDILMSEVQALQTQGGDVSQLSNALTEKAAMADPTTEAFKSTAALIEQEDRIKRSAFLNEQITSLEALAENPTPLPPLGVNRQNASDLGTRLSNLEKQTNRAAIEAAAREVAAVEIATLQQTEKLAQLQRLEAELAAETDETRKAVLETRIEGIREEIEALEVIKNPGSVLTEAEIEARVDALVEELDLLSSAVAADQQEFLKERLAEVEAEMALTTDEGVRATLEAEKKQIEANLEQTGVLTDYESQLKARQTELNLRLASNLNTTAKLSAEANLESIQEKLDNITQLQSAQAELNSIDLDKETVAPTPESFLLEQKEALELELRQLRAQIAREDDPIEKRALEQRATEVEAQLDEIPTTAETSNRIEDLRLSDISAYLSHYRRVKSKDFELSGEGKDEIEQVKAQIDLINRLNNFGYTPQTQLSELLQDLQTRESELLEEFRTASTDEKADEIRTRLVVLAEAIEQIEGLSTYDITPNYSVLRAIEKLDQAVLTASQIYLSAKTETDRRLTLQTLESLRISQRWLSRFYKPEEHSLTLAELEADLKAQIEANSTPQLVNDLVVLQSIKANMNKALAAQLETDFENFKTNLQKQAKQINDPDEKVAVENRIKALEADSIGTEVTLDEARFYEALMADMTLKVKSNLFLYADIPLAEYPQPLLFEWDLGDGETRFGQNVNHEYLTPGFYRVVLTMFDGVTSEQDLFTIRVTE